MPPLKRSHSLGNYSDDDELTGYERATAARNFRADSPSALALAMGAEIVDEEQAKMYSKHVWMQS